MTNAVFEQMKSRVAEAVDIRIIDSQIDDESELQRRVWQINEWLCDLGAPVRHKTAAVEEVAFGSGARWDEDDVDNGRPFVFEVITSKADTAGLLDLMSTKNTGDEEWPATFWVEKAFGDGASDQFIVTVSRVGDNKPSGFLVLESALYFDSYDLDLTGEHPAFEDAAKRIQFSLRAESVYVTPEKRGLGFGSALRWAVTNHSFDVLSRVAELTPDLVETMGTPTVDVYFSGDAYSIEGAMIGRSIMENLKIQCGNFSDDGDNWFDEIDFNEDFDDVDFPDDAEFPDESVLNPGR